MGEWVSGAQSVFFAAWLRAMETYRTGESLRLTSRCSMPTARCSPGNGSGESPDIGQRFNKRSRQVAAAIQPDLAKHPSDGACTLSSGLA